MNKTVRVLLIALFATSLVACAKKVVPTPTPAPTPPPAPAVTAPVETGKYSKDDLDNDSCLRQRVVYFDFDRAEIKPEFQAIMGCHAKYLNDQPSSRVTLEGHADERGTREYNLGLGERRSGAVSNALTASGGPAGSLSNVSYGEERPTCNDSDESCWGQNRRVEIVYTAK